jgi:hypothetical protein
MYLILEITPMDVILIIDRDRYPRTMTELADLKEVLDVVCKNYQKKYLIMEDFFMEASHVTSELKLALKGLFLRIQVDHHLPIFPVKSMEVAVLLLTSLAKRLQVVDKPPAMGREKPKRSTLYAAQQYLIEGLHNTGPTKATRLLAEFMNPAEIFEQIFWMQHRPSKKQLAMNPICQLHGFGKEFLDRNYMLLSQDFSADAETESIGQIKAT